VRSRRVSSATPGSAAVSSTPVERGVLERSGAHTYRSSFAPRSARADLATVVLDCGPDCVASGPTAPALHGFDGIGLPPPYHVTVLRGRNVQRTHHFVHTTTVLPRSDVARFVSAKTLTAMLDSALRDGLTSEEALHRRIVDLRSSGRPGWRSCSP